MVAYAKKKQPPRLTPQEYLERERDAETKSEYDDGIVTAMAGGSLEHNTITSNINTEFNVQLRGKDCRSLVSDMRVRVLARNKYYYPDVVVVCGEPKLEQIAGVQTLLNPALVVEVLSDSTEAKDRGEKLISYQAVKSLTTYILVTQHTPRLEIYRRHEKGWLHSVTEGLEETVSLESIGCELKLADVYARIAFPSPESEQDGSAG